jgi:shikimate dehydrogenase
MNINSNTKLLTSLGYKCSENGIYFYNKIFSLYNQNAIYISSSKSMISNVINYLDYFNFQGASVSAPYKKSIIPYLDNLDSIAYSTQSVNTIVKNVEGRWIGYNTDAIGLENVIKNKIGITIDKPKILIYGSGGVVTSVISALRKSYISPVIKIASRNKIKSLDIVNSTGIDIVDSFEDSFDLFINATPLSNTNPLLLSEYCKNSCIIFDLNPIQSKYEFEEMILNDKKKFIRGFDFYIEQFKEQFNLFVGFFPNTIILEDLISFRDNIIKNDLYLKQIL